MATAPLIVRRETPSSARLRKTLSSSASAEGRNHSTPHHVLPVTTTASTSATDHGRFVTLGQIKKQRNLRKRQKDESVWRFQIRSCLQCLRRFDRFLPFGITVLLTIVSVTAFLSAIFWPAPSDFSADSDASLMFTNRQRRQQTSPVLAAVSVNRDFSVVASFLSESSVSTFHSPIEDFLINEDDSDSADYNGLDIPDISEDGTVFRRTLEPQDPLAELGYQELKFNEDGKTDDVELVYAFDDDIKRNPYNDYDDDNIPNEKFCRRVSGYRDLPINCNNLHEFDVQYRFLSGDTKYLGEGAFREVYLAKMPTETLVFKAYVWDSDFEAEDFEWMRFDALVAEKLSPWRDQIVSIYGFCGTAMINEAMLNGDIESTVTPLSHYYTVSAREVKKGKLIVKNKLSGTQKLRYGLEMAEAIAVLHSYPGGVIVHNDIKLGQFLLTDDGRIKLNDFNRAEIMLFNEKDQEYCPYMTSIGGGTWRAPEEYVGSPLDETIDVWAMGNNLYALLTGLKPHYTIDNSSKFRRLLRSGETAFIDPRFRDRSFAESKLVDIIPLCWTHNPADRIDIFELIRLLREAVQENESSLAPLPKGRLRSS